MSKICLPLARKGPLDNRKSYANIMWLPFDWRTGLPPVCPFPHVKINKAYVACFDQETRAWFAEQNIPYWFGYNNRIGLFIRVRKMDAILTRLTWG